MKTPLQSGSVKTLASAARLKAIRKRYHTRSPSEENRAQWLDMWTDYAGPGHAPPLSMLDLTWKRLMDADIPVGGLFLYETKTGVFAGFLHYILHLDTWHQGFSCYVNDGYILPEHRPRGGIVVLYDDLIEKVKSSGWDKLYWMTKADNVAARRFYERISRETDWVRFEHDLNLCE